MDSLLHSDGDVGDFGGLQEAHDFDDVAVGDVLIGADDDFHVLRFLDTNETALQPAQGDPAALYVNLLVFGHFDLKVLDDFAVARGFIGLTVHPPGVLPC